jgi:hypothetical protein
VDIGFEHRKTLLNKDAQPSNFDAPTIYLYRNEIPSFIMDEMEYLYQNIFSSVAAEHACDSKTNTYVVRRKGRPITIFLFCVEKQHVRVLNAAIKISAEEIDRFTHYIFREFKSVTTITFQSIMTDLLNLSVPFQKVNASEDIVVTLPDTAKEYMANLGKSTRKTLKYHLSQPKRCFPSYCCRIYEPGEIDERLISDIINLSAARMQEKSKASTIDDEQKKWIKKIAATHGFVGASTIDGRICAGVICSRIGTNYFMHVIAHDPKYDDYRLGKLCCYMTICEAIARGAKEYHFLWGQGEYKYRFLGRQRDLDDLAVYRSRIYYFLNFNLVLKYTLTGYFRQSKLRVKKIVDSDTLPARALGKLVEYAYKLKWLKHGMVTARKRAP